MLKAKDIMKKNVKTVLANLTVKEAQTIMDDLKIRHLFINDDQGFLIGIISDRDIKTVLSPFIGSKMEDVKDRCTLTLPLKKIMTKKVITCSPDDDVKKCAQLMLDERFSTMPIINTEGRLIGAVSSTDLIRLLVRLI